jgi:hypothetical protein
MTGALAFVRNQRPVVYRREADGTEGYGYIAHWRQEDGAGLRTQQRVDEPTAIDIMRPPILASRHHL